MRKIITTHVCCNILDLALVSNPDFFDVNVQNDRLSDHSPVLVQLLSANEIIGTNDMLSPLFKSSFCHARFMSQLDKVYIIATLLDVLQITPSQFVSLFYCTFMDAVNGSKGT